MLQRLCAGPPEESIFMSLATVKNPMKRLSGDQKGKSAPSVPANGCAERELSDRIQSCVLPEESVATNARRLPSGDTAKAPNSVFSGGRSESSKGLECGEPARKCSTARITAASAAIRAANHGA